MISQNYLLFSLLFLDFIIASENIAGNIFQMIYCCHMEAKYTISNRKMFYRCLQSLFMSREINK